MGQCGSGNCHVSFPRKTKQKKKEEAKGTNRDNEEIKLRKGKTERKMLIADFFNKEEWINIDVDNLCVFADIGK